MKNLYISQLIIISFFIEITYSSRTRAILIGIDGFLTKCMNEAITDGFDWMKAHGSYTFKARTAIEEISGPGWSNILCALDTEDTGVTDNNWSAPWFFGKPQNITPITGNDKPFPCAFQQFKDNNINLKTSSFYSWEWFVNLGNVSIPGSIDREIFCMMDGMDSSIKCDKEAIEAGVKIIDSLDFDFFFLYFGSLDETGHATQFCSKTYIDRISALNSYINSVIEAVQKAGIIDSTYIILTSDHGAGYKTYDHGFSVNDENLLVPWIIVGPNVKQNHEIQSEVKNADTMPTIFHAMGLKSNALWRSIPILEVFNNSKLNNIIESKFLGDK